jgi:hypothetical protein
MRVPFPQAAGCYDKILQFHSIKHHLKHTWITVWLPEDKSIKKNPPLSNRCNLKLFEFSATSFYLQVHHIWPYRRTSKIKWRYV